VSILVLLVKGYDQFTALLKQMLLNGSVSCVLETMSYGVCIIQAVQECSVVAVWYSATCRTVQGSVTDGFLTKHFYKTRIATNIYVEFQL